MLQVKKILRPITHFFLPHEENNYVPHLLKEASIGTILFFVVGLCVFAINGLGIARQLNVNLSATVYPAVLADLANQTRSEQNIKQLAWNDTLATAARMKAEDMFANNYFAHTSPTGLSPWHWFDQAHYSFIYAGENLAVHFTETGDVEKAWLNSPTHRANIVDKRFSEIGVAAVDGVFEGKNTTFVVELFGTPAKVTTETTNTVTKTKQKTDTKKVGVTPKVAGAFAETEPATEVETVKSEDQFIMVKNTAPLDEKSVQKKDGNLSSWVERFIVNPTKTVRIIYLSIIAVLIASMLFMIGREYKKHHMRHLIMGILLIVIIVILLFVTQRFAPQIVLRNLTLTEQA